MELRVDPGKLDDFAGCVGRAAEGARATLAYARTYSRVPAAGQGVLGLALEGHDALRGDVLRALDRVSGILARAAEELDAAAGYYRHTDHAVAASLDAAYGRQRGARR
ncbi:hypothetical protein GCM10010218_55160 [Streptomyces mashuensis]|uniref:ESX-1 secretion-associated protein n=1 Tax=Streptomyces mashuensis TaxID=33904 RepID=A0A919B834_9ACTN|nr:type VII secretion target [Streptomyces mashuensis]GHF66548.1 hypothetical protein GCM10010218_55160 [Streptomyces mashuensis]